MTVTVEGRETVYPACPVQDLHIDCCFKRAHLRNREDPDTLPPNTGFFDPNFKVQDVLRNPATRAARPDPNKTCANFAAAQVGISRLPPACKVILPGLVRC